MDRIKNSANKTVDKHKKSVEIIKKGIKTVISFNNDNTYDVENSTVNK